MPRPVLLIPALVLALLAGCGGGHNDKAASQVAAKVNKEELSVHQINYLLQRQPNLTPEQAATASRQILEKLIDQEVALQKAEDLKIDRTPRVLQAIEAARREIISRAYYEKVGESATKPTPEEIHDYYEKHPALFKERRLYSFQEIRVQAKPDQFQALRDHLKASKTVPEFLDYLKANDIRYVSSQEVRAAEQLPLNSLETIANMKDGQSIFNPNANGATIIVLAGSRSQPVDEARAKPAIEQFLLNERKRKLIDDEVKSLRAKAKIEYVGQFAQPAASAPVPPASAVAVEAPASVALDIEKGLKGLK